MKLAYVTGAAPGKWVQRFNDRTDHPRLEATESRDPLAELLEHSVDCALVRLPESRLNDEFHRVVLYDEAPGVCVPKESELTLLDELGPADIEGEIINYQPPSSGEVDVTAVVNAVGVVAANVGVVLAPRPLLRALSAKATANREFRGDWATSMALVWWLDEDRDEIQDFVGITKGRTANSSRQVSVKKRGRRRR